MLLPVKEALCSERFEPSRRRTTTVQVSLVVEELLIATSGDS